MNKNYNQIYEKITSNKSNELIKANNVLFRRAILLIISFLVFLILVTSKITILMYIAIPFFITFVVLVIICIIKYKEQQTNYQNLYEESIIKSLVKEINPGLNVSNDNKITQEIYEDAEFEEYSSPIISGDLNKFLSFYSFGGIYGSINSRKIQISSVRLEKDNPIMLCVFSCTNLNNNIYKTSIKLRHSNDKKQTIKHSKEKVILVSSVLDNTYNVFTKDEKKANELFNSTNNKKIMNLYEKHINNPFEVTIKGNKLYIRFLSINTLEAVSSKDSYTNDQIKSLYDLIQYSLDLIELFIEIVDE